MDEEFVKACMFLLSNSMSNDPTILPTFVNMLSINVITKMLNNLNIKEECIVKALDIKNEIGKTNTLNHQAIIELFNEYGYDVEKDNQIDLQKIIFMMTEQLSFLQSINK